MLRKSLIYLSLVPLLLAACAGATPTLPVEVTEAPPQPTRVDQQPVAETPYPAPGADIPYPAPVVSEPSPYPEPPPAATPGSASGDQPGGFPATEYSPSPGDEKLTRSDVTLDLPNSDLLLMESYPVQVAVILRGSLPTPCHHLRVLPSGPDEHNRIDLQVYSLVDPQESCITVIEPFEATIPLGSYAGGKFSIWVNGEKLDEFDV